MARLAKMLDIKTQSVEGLLALTSIKGVGPVLAERIASKAALLRDLVGEDAHRILRSVPSAVAEMISQPQEVQKAIDRAESILEEAEKRRVQVVSVFDEQYPQRLKMIPDRPSLLYIKGQLLQSGRDVACIGTREPSRFGEQVTRRIVAQLVSSDWTIVSGLAIGIDTLSHRSAIESGGRTVAVMAGGLDGIYPRQNTRLAEEIVETGGALISEQPFGVPPARGNLVKRDRLQSGLSVATFVMQTDIQGGSMHTVRFTLQQRRMLFAPVPAGSHAAEPKSRGLIALTAQTGSWLADALMAEGDYRDLLLSKFSHSPVAISLNNRDDYALMLDLLQIEYSKGINRTDSVTKGGLL
jgi:DNA processing protein